MKNFYYGCIIGKICSIKGKVQSIKKSLELTAKDPNDWTLTRSSTAWEAQQHWCTTCKTDRSHAEHCSDICNNCGSFNSIDLFGCSIREIYNGEKWVTQYKERHKVWLSK